MPELVRVLQTNGVAETRASSTNNTITNTNSSNTSNDAEKKATEEAAYKQWSEKVMSHVSFYSD